MFKINRKIEYALIALKYMSDKAPGQLTSAKEICDTYQTPFDPTARVLQLLTQASVLQAEQGARGGYQIVRDLSKVSMKELYRVIIGPIEIANCFHRNYSNCDISGKCQIIAPMLNLNQNIIELFEKIMIADLIKSKNQGEKSIRKNKAAV